MDLNKQKKRNRVVARGKSSWSKLVRAVRTFASRGPDMWQRHGCRRSLSEMEMELNSSFRGSVALNRWPSVVQIASEVFIYRWNAWSLVYLPGICFMLSVTAAENGAIIIKKNSFFSLLWWLYFSASAFMDGRDSVGDKSLPTRRKRSLNELIEENSHKRATKS